jgi:hypothetical protein
VLPNGHLVVAGEKQIGVNQNVDVLRFSGTIDPRMLQPGSIINSTQVANVRVESRGRRPERSPDHGLAGPLLHDHPAVLSIHLPRNIIFIAASA